MRTAAILTALSLLGVTLAGDVFESLCAVPKGWSEVSAAPEDAKLRFRISMKHPNKEVLEESMIAISSPSNPRWRQHMSKAELKALVKPRDESTSAVLAWLKESGIADENIVNKNEWIHFVATVGQAQAMLETQFNIYNNDFNNAQSIRTLQYSVPEDVAEHINLIHPTTRFNNMKAMHSEIHKVEKAQDLSAAKEQLKDNSVEATTCASSVTPDCLRNLYNIGDYYATPSDNSLFGVCGYLDEYAKYDALETFLETYATYAEGANFTYALINGGLDTQDDNTDDDTEANLDIQYAVSISYNTPVTYYSTGGLGPLDPDLAQPDQPGENEPYLDFLEYMLDLDDDELPQTITTSYGEDEQSVPLYYTTEVCDMFGQLGARGVSIIFSSGDTGVGSGCESNDGTNTTQFLPVFPAACPWVTSVGAVTGVAPEAAVSFSSGGFSNRFARPSYQDDAVTTYLDSIGDTFSEYYNASGRGFPDVAAQGVDFHVIEYTARGVARDVQVSGTSASGPTFAAIVSLLNNALLADGQSPLGFLNTWLYETGYQGLNDITSGSSSGCKTSPVIAGASWNATEGWDPVTGYGTPDFGALMTLLGLSTTSTSGRNGTGIHFRA